MIKAGVIDPTKDVRTALQGVVSVAETVGGADGQNTIVCLRQNGQDSLSVEFYRSTA